MVIDYYGLWYLIIDDKKKEKRIKKRLIESDNNDTGYALITAEELENLTNVDQENIELFYGTEKYEQYRSENSWPYIEINGRMMFYSHNWRNSATEIKLKYYPENIRGIYYFEDNLEQNVYALRHVDIFLLTENEPIIPFYYPAEVKWIDGKMFIDLELPNTGLSKEFKKYTRIIGLRVLHPKFKPMSIVDEKMIKSIEL